MSNTFYVYEHWRLDKDECFYVGKGSGYRAYKRTDRGAHWSNIVSKLERIGSAYEIRIVECGLTESEAFDLEIKRIEFWQDKVDLSNKTRGGEGVSGLIMSDESKAKMSAKKIGKPSPRKGVKLSNEQKIKISENVKNLWENPAYKEQMRKSHLGKSTITEDGRKKLSIAGSDRKHTDETKQKLRELARMQWAKRREMSNP